MDIYVASLEKHKDGRDINTYNSIQTFTQFFYIVREWSYPITVVQLILSNVNIGYGLGFISFILPKIFQPDRGGVLLGFWEEYIA